MPTWDGYAKQGDSIKIIAVFPDTYGGFTTGLSATVTIAMDLAGSALVSGAAMTESTALSGIYYYAYTVPASGFIYAKATSSAGDSICTWIVGTGTIPDMASETTLSAVDGKVDTVDGIVDAILADTNELQTNQGNWLTADVSALATQASVDTVDTVVDAILADTNELQANQGNWLTADISGLSTFDPATDTVIVGNPNDCKADISALALQSTLLAVKTKTDNLPAAPAAEPNATTNKNEILMAISNITDGSTPGTGSYPLTVTVTEVNTTPIGSARVEVWNQAGTLRLASTVTDMDGIASFVLDEGTYTVRVNLVGWEFILPASVVHSAPATAITITGNSIYIGNPIDSSLCRVYVWCFDQAGVEPIKTIKVSAHLVNEPVFHSGKLLSLTYYKNYYNAETGLLYWDIPRLTTVRVIIKETGFDHEVDIPDLASVFLKDLTTN